MLHWFFLMYKIYNRLHRRQVSLQEWILMHPNLRFLLTLHYKRVVVAKARLVSSKYLICLLHRSNLNQHLSRLLRRLISQCNLLLVLLNHWVLKMLDRRVKVDQLRLLKLQHSSSLPRRRQCLRKSSHLRQCWREVRNWSRFLLFVRTLHKKVLLPLILFQHNWNHWVL